MRLANFFRSLILTAALSISFFAQDKAPEPSPTASPAKTEAQLELEKNAFELADTAANEAGSLKLWENRALVYALAGELLWESDQKRARKLFQNAANELNLGKTEPKEKPKDYYEDYNYWRDFSPRFPVLLIIARFDPDWALQLLKETRPADVQAAMDATEQRVPTTNQKLTEVQRATAEKNRFQAGRELQMEQSFATQAALKDPVKAAKLIRESLKKGVSYSVFDLLRKIFDKDEKLGKELQAEIVQKILDTDFKQDEETERTGAFLLLQSTSAEIFKSERADFKPLKLEESQIKALANKLADALLQKQEMRFFEINLFLKPIEKYAPEKATLLKQKLAAADKNLTERQKANQDFEKLVSNPDTKPETLMTEAEKFIGYQKYELYSMAVQKFLEAGQGEKAREMLQNAPSSKQRDDALKQLDEKLSSKAIKDDKFDDVQTILGKTESDSSKIKILVELAVGYNNKKTDESRETALRLMTEARRLTATFPDSNEDIADLLKLASGYARIEPDQVFPILAPLIEMSNDLLTARSLIAKYNKRNFLFKQGELIFTNNLNGIYSQYAAELALVAAHDFSRTKGLIEQFRRDDVRTLVKIILAQSILKGKIGADGIAIYYSDEN